MVPNLLNELQEQFFSSDVSGKIAQTLGESPAPTQSALGGALSALIGGLMSKASNTTGAGELLEVLTSHRAESSALTNSATALGSADGIANLMKLGGPLLSTIFGARSDEAADRLASMSGIQKSSASSLLSLALPLVLGWIGKSLSSTGWNVSNLMSLLDGQRRFLQDVPGGLLGSLAAPLDATVSGSARPIVTESTDSVPLAGAAQAVYRGEPASGVAWWKWLLPVLALLVLIPWITSRSRQPEPVGTPAVSESANASAPGATGSEVAATPAPQPTEPSSQVAGAREATRPSGADALNFPEGSVERRLIQFIEDASRPVAKATWFSLRGVHFETASAKLRPDSMEQLRRVAAILEAYPSVHLKLGGYTDNVGNDVLNQKLSQERAASARQALAQLGIEPSRLESEGYGEEHPVGDNATEEGRQRNRRIDARVTRR